LVIVSDKCGKWEEAFFWLDEFEVKGEDFLQEGEPDFLILIVNVILFVVQAQFQNDIKLFSYTHRLILKLWIFLYLLNRFHNHFFKNL
jgi:hypothetical protein